MTAIAQQLDQRLKKWRPATARKVEKLVAEIIGLADAEVSTTKAAGQKRQSPQDSLFADTHFFAGPVPKDSAQNHDQYLYGEEA